MAITIPSGAGNLVLGNNLPEFINGTGSNDTIYGYAGNDLLEGRGGNDYIDGGLGDDGLYGGLGNNTLVGGAGNDALYATYDGLLGSYTKGDTDQAGIRDVLIGGSGTDDFFLYGDGFNNYSYYDLFEGLPNVNSGAFAGTTTDSFATVKDLQVGESVGFSSNIYDLVVQNFGSSVRIGYDYAASNGSIDDLIGVLNGVQVSNLSISPLNLTLDNTFYTVTRIS